MLNLLAPEDMKRLRDLFRDAGYTEENLRKYLGAAELPSHQLRNTPRLLDRTRERTPLNALLRWFWIGQVQSAEEIAPTVHVSDTGLLLAAGVLARSGDRYEPSVMLLPVGELLVAADHPSAIDRGESEMVLWPNPTSKFLGRFAVRRPSRATLDLGTGSGILSLAAAGFSDAVVATDLTARSAEFATFNAKLNAIEGIEVLVGDGFEPVAGRTFDLILSNPPFFITPNSEYLFCNNPMELDQLCQRLVREGPSHLNEGGYMQMLCEWAEIEGEPWQERVGEWLRGLGCDAWLMKGVTQDPAEYAQQRIRDTTQNTGRDAELYEGYMSYYRARKVKAIHGGLIVLHRRTGPGIVNWIRMEEVPESPTGDLGELVESTFAANYLLHGIESDAALLITPRLAANVRLEQIRVQVGNEWQTESLTLRQRTGFGFQLTVQPLVAEFLASCDGRRTAGAAIEQFAAVVNAPIEQVRKECLATVRTLIEQGFMIAVMD